MTVWTLTEAQADLDRRIALFQRLLDADAGALLDAHWDERLADQARYVASLAQIDRRLTAIAHQPVCVRFFLETPDGTVHIRDQWAATAEEARIACGRAVALAWPADQIVWLDWHPVIDSTPVCHRDVAEGWR